MLHSRKSLLGANFLPNTRIFWSLAMPLIPVENVALFIWWKVYEDYTHDLFLKKNNPSSQGLASSIPDSLSYKGSN